METEEADIHQELSGPDGSLDDQFGKLERKEAVEAEIDALKKKMGKNDA